MTVRGYETLFSPGRINRLTLKNRIIFPVMAMHFDHPNGETSEDTIAFFGRLARGGVGMIMTNHMRALTLKNRPRLETLSLHQKQITVPPNQVDLRKQCSRVAWAPLEPLPALNPKIYNLVEAAHVNGAAICAALSPIPTGWVLENYDPDDPEGQGISLFNRWPVSDIEESIKEFATVAGELKRIGFDAVEIAGGYPGDCFTLKSFNKRQDKYGVQSLETRLRFHQELIQATRGEVGKEFPLLLLFDIDHFGAKGWRTLEESKTIVKKFEEWGIDCIRARGGGSVRVEYDIGPMYLPKGFAIHLAAGIKEVADVPVVACCKLWDPDLAESVLREGKADFIAMGRGLIADPDLPNKIRAGQSDHVRPCISCNIGCLGNLVSLPRRPSRCSVNPMFGHEARLPDFVGLATRKKKIVVVGAGPAGMSAAHTAALRGHDVVLFEKTSSLGGGGIFRLAVVPPYKQELTKIPEFYNREFRDLGNLRIEFSKEADTDMVMAEKPDAVIVATGGVPSVPDLPGVDGPVVIDYQDVLLGKKAAGDRVVVMGGNSVGCEVALHLLLNEKKKHVIILGSLHRLADDVEVASRNCLMAELTKTGAEMITMGRIKAISGSQVLYLKEGKEIKFEGDTIVNALASKPNNQLYLDLKNRILALYIVGDAKEPRQIIDAVSEGFWAAYHL